MVNFRMKKGIEITFSVKTGVLIKMNYFQFPSCFVGDESRFIGRTPDPPDVIGMF